MLASGFRHKPSTSHDPHSTPKIAPPTSIPSSDLKITCCTFRVHYQSHVFLLKDFCQPTLSMKTGKNQEWIVWPTCLVLWTWSNDLAIYISYIQFSCWTATSSSNRLSLKLFLLLLLPTLFIQGVNCVESAFTTLRSLASIEKNGTPSAFWSLCCYSTPYYLPVFALEKHLKANLTFKTIEILEATSVRSVHFQPGPPNPEPQRLPHFHGSALHSAATPDNTTNHATPKSEVSTLRSHWYLRYDRPHMPLHGTSRIDVVKQCYPIQQPAYFWQLQKSLLVTLCEWLPMSRASRK